MTVPRVESQPDRPLWRVGSLAIATPVMLAPMEGHTDLAFRTLCRELGADVVFTEFTAWQTLCGKRGNGMRKIRLADEERPAGIQLYGREPIRMAEAARIACALGPELIDLNFGCPAKRVNGGGCGSQLMREPDLLVDVVRHVIAAADRPVTCKLRLGWDETSINVVDVAQRLEALGVAGLTVHGRTRCQRYEGHADWDWIAKVVDAVHIPVIANGDVDSADDAEAILQRTGAAGVMIGRAVLEDPWILSRVRARLSQEPAPPPPDDSARLAACRRLLELSVGERGEVQGVRRMRSRYRIFLGHRPDFAELRRDLVRLETLESVQHRLASM